MTHLTRIVEPIRRLAWPPPEASEPDALVTREWLVTNGLGGYASGTVAGVITRRYHGLLIAALPAPLGRTVTWLSITVRPSGAASAAIKRPW